MAAFKQYSSSEDENEAKFREAAIDSTYILGRSDAPKQNDTFDNHKKKPSLRPDRELIDDDDYVLNTTPGFRTHVSRKLSEMIESQIDEVGAEVKCINSEKTETEGIKLFAGSAKFLQTDTDVSAQKTFPRKQKKYPSSSSSDSSDIEKFAEAAVSHDFIVKESRLLQERPADVILKADGLSKNENCDTAQDKNRSDKHADNGSNCLDLQKNHKVKKKKKKKKDNFVSDKT